MRNAMVCFPAPSSPATKPPAAAHQQREHDGQNPGVDGGEDVGDVRLARFCRHVEGVIFPLRLADSVANRGPSLALNGEVNVGVGVSLPTLAFQDPAGLTTAAGVPAARHRIVYASNHMSHCDHLVEPLVLDDNGVRPPLIAAGINHRPGSFSHHRCALFRTQRLTPADLCRGSRGRPQTIRGGSLEGSSRGKA